MQVSDKIDDMTSSLDETNVTLDDSLVYIPLEDVPDGLLDKLPDFKVVVKDKQGDRIFPKERLEEVLKSTGRVGSPVPVQIGDKKILRMNHGNCSNDYVNDCKDGALNQSLSNYSTPSSSPKRQIFPLSHEEYELKETTPRKCEFPYCYRFNAHKVDTSFPSDDNQPMHGVSRHQKINPQYSTVPCSPDLDSDSCSYEANISYCPKRPVKKLHRRLCRTDTPDVARPRKRLFFSTDSRMESDCDSLVGRHSRNIGMRAEGESNVRVGTHSCPKSPQCGLKRKYSFSQNEADNSHWDSRTHPFTTTGRTAEHPLHVLHPGNVHRIDQFGVDQYHQMTSAPHCACSLVKSNLLRMTKSAYENIGRQNCTPISFEEFRNELKEINSLLQESVNVLHAVEQLCCHN